MNKVIASTDIVAADAYATGSLRAQAAGDRITVTAAKRGLGEMNLEKIKVDKGLEVGL